MGILSEDIMSSDMLRIAESLLAIIIVIKLLYYLKLLDSFAHLVNIIFIIFNEIISFFIILSMSIFGFSTSFYLLGKN